MIDINKLDKIKNIGQLADKKTFNQKIDQFLNSIKKYYSTFFSPNRPWFYRFSSILVILSWIFSLIYLINPLDPLPFALLFILDDLGVMSVAFLLSLWLYTHANCTYLLDLLLSYHRGAELEPRQKNQLRLKIKKFLDNQKEFLEDEEIIDEILKKI